MSRVSSKLASAVKCSDDVQRRCLHALRRLYRGLPDGHRNAAAQTVPLCPGGTGGQGEGKYFHHLLLPALRHVRPKTARPKVNIADNVRFLRKYINENEFNLS